MLLHVRDDLTELHPENHCEQGTGHVEPLLSIVVSVILSGSSQGSLNQSVGHVTSEVCFLELIACLDAKPKANVRQHVVFQYVLCKLDTLLSGMLMDWTTHLCDIVKAVVLRLVAFSFFKRWSEGLGHCSITFVA